MDDTGRLINRVNALNAPSPDAEETLMDGYAHALALEAERTRLEQRFAALAQAVAEDHDMQRLPELRTLKQRISRTEDELARLREVLTAVRQRIAAASAAAAAAENV
jgi:predicted  nucleic acid-binding Zn-ribbon protein